ncbi:Arylsulfatase E [Stylophora pistillata]|uniref:Arylsulfatase E n=1 Tax=Stylophora pistillata TaxID=50429 RepID=A0A2B4RK37_STYPI|nr:Arylsulfatase E [Stylophora pistillata]
MPQLQDLFHNLEKDFSPLQFCSRVNEFFEFLQENEELELNQYITPLHVAFAKPNVLVFLVDDLGIADLGCFGNDTIKTPNIDRLAEQEAPLRHDVTPDSICTPNRAAFLTGRYPIRSGLASDQGQIRVFIFAASSGGLPPNETTFAEIASAAGYKTGRLGSSISNEFH